MKRRALLLVLSAGVLAGCSVERQPDVALAIAPTPFRNAHAASSHGSIDETWPALFGDPVLVHLVDAALKQNLDVAAANARVGQARAAVLASTAYQVPSVGIAAGFSRNRASGTVDDALPKRTLKTWSTALGADYQVDLWGRLRGEADAAREDELATEAAAAAARLRVAAEVAGDYLTIRFVAADIATLERSIELRQTALELVRHRAAAGTVSDLDVLRAITELHTTNAELADSERLRQNLLDALAVLLGESAPSFALAPGGEAVEIPAVPVRLPAEVLAQRPDVYEAERRLDVAGLQIGVAKTAWLPDLTLTADGGFASRDLGSFLDRNSSLWGLAATVALTLFDGGRRDAALLSAKAQYGVAEANYRSVAFAALREVQDALNDIAAQRVRTAEFEVAETASGQAARLSRRRYVLGYVDYFEVVNSDRDALDIERDLIHARQALAVATVGLVSALGGGWTSAGNAKPPGP